MARFDGPSRCSSAKPLTFRWFGFPPCEPHEDNIDAAVEVLMAKVTPPGRVWNPWSGTMVKREFRHRIVHASKGELVPVDEVKPVDVANPPPLYEIRWQDINVTDRLEDGTQRFGKVAVRMYHSEPEEAPGHFIGHHAHEKDLTATDVNAAQNEEIATAIGWYRQGRDSKWGIAGEAT